jgi:hypothetical protein
MNLASAVWCFACDASFATREQSAQHVAESPVHRDNECRLTLPYTTADGDGDCKGWTPSSPSTGNDSVPPLPEIGALPGSGSNQVGCLIAASAVSERCRRLTSATSNDDKQETVEPSSALTRCLCFRSFSTQVTTSGTWTNYS